MKPEMPKSLLNVLFAVVVMVVPVFFIVLFLGTARRKKRLKATVQAQAEHVAGQLRQRCEVLIETIKATPGQASQTLLQAAESELQMLRRFEPAPANITELARADAVLEAELQPWMSSLPDSYGKRKLMPSIEQANQARARYNEAARICGQGMFPLFEGSET